jgi:hypothetical protein
MVLVLEIGLFWMASLRGAGRAFWLGFETAGWTYVLMCMIFAEGTWSLTRSLFERGIIGRKIGLQFEMERFVLFAFGFQLMISLAIALSVGSLARMAWRRWVSMSRGT